MDKVKDIKSSIKKWKNISTSLKDNHIGISPNGKEFDAVSTYEDGLISFEEMLIALGKKQPLIHKTLEKLNNR